jgi:hypothetical protein
MNQSMLTAATQASGRLLISPIFVIAGIDKLGAPAVTQGSRESMGVPGALLPLVILLELGGGLSVLLGWWTRIGAFLLASFLCRQRSGISCQLRRPDAVHSLHEEYGHGRRPPVSGCGRRGRLVAGCPAPGESLRHRHR